MAIDQPQKVQLGCGTLILIALIVLIFSNNNRSNRDLESEVHDLTTEVRQLKSAVVNQTLQIQLLQAKLNEQRLPAERP